MIHQLKSWPEYFQPVHWPRGDIAGLITKLAAIMTDTQRMPKDERNPQGWSYTSVMDMLDAVRPAMAKHGLAMVPDVEACEWSEGQSARGTAMTTCHMTVRWTVYDGATGASINFRTIGESMDSSDKSTNKAMTAAQKLAVSKLVMMSTGDAEDADASHEERVARPDAPRRDAPAPHGICPDHGVPYFQSPKMRSPAHKIDGGGWCDKPADRPDDDLGWNSPVEAAARATATVQPPRAAPMPQENVVAPHGACALHKVVNVKTQSGVIGHWRTENGRRVICEGRPAAPSLAEQAAQIAAARGPTDPQDYRDVGAGQVAGGRTTREGQDQLA